MGKTILTFLHLGSFALSFGLVLFCDMMMLQVPLSGRICPFRQRLIEQASRLILGGLAILIATGFGFFLYYWLYTPEALSNPKLYAKMMVVTILSINGYWLHRRGLTILNRALETDLRLASEHKHLRRLLVSGMVSGISWWTAFIFGTFRELNFTVSFWILVAAYALATLGGFATIEGYMTFLKRVDLARPVPVYVQEQTA